MRVDGKVIGAIGVSGALSSQDAQVAKAGAECGREVKGLLSRAKCCNEVKAAGSSATSVTDQESFSGRIPCR